MTTTLAPTRGAELMPDPGAWQTMLSMAQQLVDSGLLPATIKTPAAAVAIMQKGVELGVPPMHALSSIVVIQGKPTCSAELMAALIYRDHGDAALEFTEATDTRCTVTYKRRSWAARQTYSFSMADASRAGLADKGEWKKYPAAMLRARAVSAIARMAFPDTIGGMYTPEELGASVTVAGDGSIVPIAETVPRDDDVEVREPGAIVVDILHGPSEADLIVEELADVTEKDELRAMKARIRAADLTNDPFVRPAYEDAWRRVIGASTREEGQAELVGV